MGDCSLYALLNLLCLNDRLVFQNRWTKDLKSTEGLAKFKSDVKEVGGAIAQWQCL